MPDPRPLNSLRARMVVALNISHGHRDAVWGEPKLMTSALKGVKQAFGGDDDGMRPERGDLVDAVRSFFRSRQVASFTELKYVCHGVTLPVDADGQRLIDRTALFARLLELVDERQAQAKQFRRCYQGLMSGYFGFERQPDLPGEAQANWLRLRGYLGQSLAPVDRAARSRGRQPEWLETLAQHQNLLGDQPCERYAEALRRGDRSELAGVCKGLGIESSSWVWHEAMMAYVQAVVRAGEPTFKSEMGQVLAVVDGQHPDLKVPAPIARDAAALVVAKYERCSSKPEHPELRDVCLRRIGNPWLERVAWDSAVGSEPARQMIESWLKRRLIRDFFELLAHDGSADVRRLTYWLKWEPKISDMWFVLGANAQHKQSKQFVDLRGRMAGRLRWLSGTSDGDNNAFIMRIGPLLVVEYGMTGNACYVFEAESFKVSLDEKALSIHKLKQKASCAAWLPHGGPWEQKFDQELKQLLGASRTSTREAPRQQGASELKGRTPSAVVAASRLPLQNLTGDPEEVASANRAVWPDYRKPIEGAPGGQEARSSKPKPRMTDHHLSQLRGRCERAGIVVDDHRDKGGALWIRNGGKTMDNQVMAMILAFGFRWVAGKGYYLDGED